MSNIADLEHYLTLIQKYIHELVQWLYSRHQIVKFINACKRIHRVKDRKTPQWSTVKFRNSHDLVAVSLAVSKYGDCLNLSQHQNKPRGSTVVHKHNISVTVANEKPVLPKFHLTSLNVIQHLPQNHCFSKWVPESNTSLQKVFYCSRSITRNGTFYSYHIWQ